MHSVSAASRAGEDVQRLVQASKNASVQPDARQPRRHAAHPSPKRRLKRLSSRSSRPGSRRPRCASRVRAANPLLRGPDPVRTGPATRGTKAGLPPGERHRPRRRRQSPDAVCAILRAGMRDEAGLLFSACGPFCTCGTSNATIWPSAWGRWGGARGGTRSHPSQAFPFRPNGPSEAVAPGRCRRQGSGIIDSSALRGQTVRDFLICARRGGKHGGRSWINRVSDWRPSDGTQAPGRKRQKG